MATPLPSGKNGEHRGPNRARWPSDLGKERAARVEADSGTHAVAMDRPTRSASSRLGMGSR
ncbi:hypothetical protein E2562_033927 [Oryza meyeriana var. granulata]|uniref:Uncharacterized protein n=1 Tax=Oryza meyeriana var. granulata TaxID=110450 RepID=A0A6G1C0T0_9ORYZ|nr:hypothetical protein E2562_033927 [Oryza meyeriana var. granulata]